MENALSKKTLLADISLFIVAVIWGGGFIAGKVALFYITPLYLLSFRFLLSALILLIIFFNRIIKIDKKSLLSGIFLGVLLYFAQACQTIGLKYTTAGKQSFLIASYTIIVPIISWLLTKNKPDIYSILSSFLTLAGIGFLSLQGNFSISYGDSLSLIYAAIFALMIVLIGIYAKNVDPIHLTTIQLLTAGILTLISALIFESGIGPMNFNLITSIVYLVIFNTTIALLVQNTAQKYTSDIHASIIISLQSVFGCFLSILLMGEIFTQKMIIGSMLIFIAVILSQVKDKIFNIKYFLQKSSPSSIEK